LIVTYFTLPNILTNTEEEEEELDIYLTQISNKKAQLSLTNPNDISVSVAQFIYM